MTWQSPIYMVGVLLLGRSIYFTIIAILFGLAW